MVDEPTPQVVKATVGVLVVPFTSDAARALADLQSVRKDLEEAKEYVEQLQAMPFSTHKGEDHAVLRPALSKAVVISYRRAFASGKSFVSKRSRTRYPDTIVDGLSPADQDTHTALLEEANRHVAHRVSDDREHGEVLVTLNPPHDPGVQGVGWAGLRYGGARDELVAAVSPLCSHLVAELEIEIATLTGTVRSEAEAEVDRLYLEAGVRPLGPG